MRTIVTKDGETYQGFGEQFEDKPGCVVFKNGNTRYRIHTETIASDKEQEGCYVATYAYGSPDAPEVQALRRLRDQVLSQSAAGRLFVRAYYAWLSALAIRVIGALGRPARAATCAALDALARWSDERLAGARERPAD